MMNNIEIELTPKYRFRIDINGQKDDIRYLKGQKEKLVVLLTKITKSKEDLESTQMSGKTFDQAVIGCEFFRKKIENRIEVLEKLIVLLEDNCQKYENVYYTTYKSVGSQGE